jgi:hypothetical protein
VDLGEEPRPDVHRGAGEDHREQRELTAAEEEPGAVERRGGAERGGDQRARDLAADDPEVALRPDPEDLAREDR